MKQQSNNHRRIFLPNEERGGPPSQGFRTTLKPIKTVYSLNVQCLKMKMISEKLKDQQLKNVVSNIDNGDNPILIMYS